MKGIILAGGTGTRLYPLTKETSKHLLPLHNKPMIYYPLSVLMEAGIQDILIISTPQYISQFQILLGCGQRFGVSFSYAVQPNPDGIAQAFIIGEKFIGNSNVALILGDNIFAGTKLRPRLQKAVQDLEAYNGAALFAYEVKDPKRYGIVELDESGQILSLEEKPCRPKSNYCITGLYFYDNCVIQYVKDLKPGIRGELEITDINQMYLKKNSLRVELLETDYTWFDAGTHESLKEASLRIESIEQNTCCKPGRPEDTARQHGWI